MERLLWKYYWVKDGISRATVVQVKNPERTRVWRKLRKALDEDKVEKIGYSKCDFDSSEANIDF